MVPVRFSRLSLLLLPAVVLVACANAPAETTGAPASAEGDDGGAVSVDEVEIVGGVPDRNRDPAVIAVEIEGDALCTGTLVAPRVVLTARHCVSRTAHEIACPASGSQITGDRDPSKLAILSGDDPKTAEVVAHGAEIVVPPERLICDHDVAFIVLDQAVTHIKPAAIATKGAAKGDRVRAVGYGLTATDGTSAGTKLVREHVKVLDVSAAEFLVGEATCSGDSGGPAIDETTGEIVGVVSRGGPACEGPGVHNVYTRVDVFAGLFEKALAAAGGSAHPPASKSTPPSDIGGPCTKGSDCAAGMCITEAGRQYCSRTCGNGDRCPKGFHCKAVSGTTHACVIATK